jgi:transcriptional regulator of acetoin/glycerol metabolism
MKIESTKSSKIKQKIKKCKKLETNSENKKTKIMRANSKEKRVKQNRKQKLIKLSSNNLHKLTNIQEMKTSICKELANKSKHSISVSPYSFQLIQGNYKEK